MHARIPADRHGGISMKAPASAGILPDTLKKSTN
jgi:hypothetical protein